jgi:hypothetical protein
MWQDRGFWKGVTPKVEGSVLSSKGKALLILFVGGAAIGLGALSSIYTPKPVERIHVKEIATSTGQR